MRVFKFGGASIKDAESVQNVLRVLNHYSGEDLVIVVSAMGKTTNAMEKLVEAYMNSHPSLASKLADLKDFHLAIIDELFLDKKHKVFETIDSTFTALKQRLNEPVYGEYNFIYDQIVPFGEVISTQVVSAYLQSENYENTWLDARELIRTDNNHRFARVNWEKTSSQINKKVKSNCCYVVQGFIASCSEGISSTLGREGSDYTASIFAYCLNAVEVIIWKDVQGVLNGDPKVFSEVQLLTQISYKEAIELAYYGASVIHPKTIQPLMKKDIAFRVKSFVHPEREGTTISNGVDMQPMIPCYIKKSNQLLITIATTDLAFIVEDHLSKVYQIFHEFGVRVNLSQNTAVSSSFCINNDPMLSPKVLQALSANFKTHFNEEVSLYTVRYYDDESKNKVRSTGKVLMEQITRNTYQVVIH